MWCTGVFVASSALNAFVSLLLRTQDPGNDNTLRLSGVILALHVLGVVQVFVPSGAYAYLQWACSAPLLCWLLTQLLGTMPPGTGALSAQGLYRSAILEVFLALGGLVLALAVDLPVVRMAGGLVSVTALSLDLLPLLAPHVLPHLASAPGASAGGGGGGLLGILGSAGGAAARIAALLPGGGIAAAASGGFNSDGNNGGSSIYAGPGSSSGFGSRLAVRGPAPRVGGGAGSAFGGGSGSGHSLPIPMEVVICAAAGGKVLQALSAAAAGAATRGRGLSLFTGGPGMLPCMIWSLSTALTLYGLPLAVGMYYGLVRYAASMLVVRRSVLRRVSSLGMIGVGMPLPGGLAPGEDGAGGVPGPRSSLNSIGGSGVLRRTGTYGTCGGDSDSDSGLPALPSRLLEVGDLYRITESSGHSIAYSTSGDEGWRNDLALTQLLYMARTTFRRSSDEQRTGDGAAAGTVSGGGASGGPGSAGTAGGGSGEPPGSPLGPAAAPAAAAAGNSFTRRSPPPTPPLPTASTSVQTEHRVSFGSRNSEAGVQCNIGPPTVVKEVVVEVPVQPQGPHGLSPAGDGGDSGPLMTLIRALREHSSDIAHDMKNPLNGVLALSQNVLQGTFGELPTAAADQLGVVRACAYHLLNMINQLRDCMRMLHGGEPDGNLGRVQLSNAIEEVLKRMSPMVGSRLTIRAEHDPSLIVFADDGRLYQSVHTVLANAFKYTRKGGVTIETSTTADKSSVTLRVSDTGTGFTGEQLDKFNSPLTGSPEEQLGLGLTMVKRTMAYFGGVLRLGNRTGGTSGGWVELTFRAKEEVPPLGAGLPPPPQAAAAAPVPPAAAAAGTAATTPAAAAVAVTAAAPPPPPAAAAAAGREQLRKNRKSLVGSSERPGLEERLAAANSSNDRGGSGGRGPSTSSAAPGGGAAASVRGTGSAALTGGGINDDVLTGKGDEPVRVLIVDDDPVNLTILEDLLRAEGYDVLTAASGTEALEVYLTSDPQPKLVLLDVTLPDLSGHEVCLKMRSLTPGVPPPIIMISGKASTKDVIKGLQAGACDYITKPFQPQEVMARVETQLRLFMGEVAQLQEAAERNMSLLRQILPPHILASLRGGTRVLVEKFSDVVVLCADVVGFSALAAAADTADCILTLNRLFSTFDALTDKMGVHKMDCHTDSYVASLGHMPQDRHISNTMQVKQMLDLAREMLAAVDSLPYPDTLGKMQIRIGLHVGAVYGGVIGVKYPRYSLFGSTLRLAQGLQATALPNSIHVTEAVHNRVRAAGGESFIPYTTSQVQSLGIIRTYLVGGGPDGGTSPGMLDYSHLESGVVLGYLRSTSTATHGISVLNCLLGDGGGGAAPATSVGLGPGLGLAMGLSAGPMINARPALGLGATAATAAVLEASAAAAPPRAGPAITAGGASRSGGGGSGGGGGGSGSGYKIIPVISSRHLSGSGGGAGPDDSTSAGGAGGGAGGGGVGGGGSGGNAVGPARSRESDASGYAITLAQVPHITLDPNHEIMSTAVAVASSDLGHLMTMDTAAVLAAPPGASIATSPSASASSASGILSTATFPAGASAAGAGVTSAAGIVNGFQSTAAVGISGFSGSSAANKDIAGGGAGGAGGASGPSRRHTSDASLVQDLSPGPPAAGLSGLTRMQRMHAGGPHAPGSGAASPRLGGGGTSRGGSNGPSRNASFRVVGGASPLAATLMHQQLMTALQQQANQQQQQQVPPGGPQSSVLGTAPAQSMQSVGYSVGDMELTRSPVSTSEPLMKLDRVDGAAAAGTSGVGGGISSATMRRIHMPLKAASIGALQSSGGGGGGVAVARSVGGGSAAAAGSAAGSVSASGMSTAGSLGSPPLLFSPTGAAPLGVGTAAAAHVVVSGGGGGAARAAVAAASAAALSVNSPYAGLSSETRARLARLRTASQPDLHDPSSSAAGFLLVPYSREAGSDVVASVAPVSPEAVYSATFAAGGEHGAFAAYGLGRRHASSGPAPRHSPATSAVRTSSGAVGLPAGAASLNAAAAAAPHHHSPTPTVSQQQLQPQQPSTGAAAAAAVVRRPPLQRPSNIPELLDSLGLGHYSRSINGAVAGGLDELASLDDSGLRKAGLMGSRSRQLVRDELTRWGYNK